MSLSLLDNLAQQIAGRQQLCVAFSGGLDSSVLLHALVSLRATQLPQLQLRAIHIHHGLSQFADQWAAHCEEICRSWQVELKVSRVTVDAKHGGIEAAARSARYQAFSDYLLPAETLVTAQHLDDQCETFLLALKRGSGPAGLSAMRQQANHDYLLLRPLLSCSRQKLEAYAQLSAIRWIEDDSNRDVRFDRNFLRLQVLPQLYQRWPHFAQATARSASLCAEQEALLDELLEESLNRLIDQQGSLSLDEMLCMSASRRDALLRRWLGRHHLPMPAREQLQRLWDEVALSRDDATPQLQLGAITVRRFRQRLYVVGKISGYKDVQFSWEPNQNLVLPDNLGTLRLSRQEEGNTQCVRQLREGEQLSVHFYAIGKIQIVGRQHARELKKLWQELAIPPWERDRIPLIFYNEQLIAAAGVFVTREAQPEPQESEWYLVWEKN